MEPRIILDTELLNLTIERLCRELIENFDNFKDTVLIGVQPRGAILGAKIHQKTQSLIQNNIPFGKLDTTFHRDDFRRGDDILKAASTEINFEIEGKKVVLIDDVLFTGRTIRAAMDALLSYGRPEKVELLVLIDRRFNRELPIQPDFVGKTVDTVEPVKVKVEWKGEGDGTKDRVWLLPENEK